MLTSHGPSEQHVAFETASHIREVVATYGSQLAQQLSGKAICFCGEVSCVSAQPSPVRASRRGQREHDDDGEEAEHQFDVGWCRRLLVISPSYMYLHCIDGGRSCWWVPVGDVQSIVANTDATRIFVSYRLDSTAPSSGGVFFCVDNHMSRRDDDDGKRLVDRLAACAVGANVVLSDVMMLDTDAWCRAGAIVSATPDAVPPPLPRIGGSADPDAVGEVDVLRHRCEALQGAVVMWEQRATEADLALTRLQQKHAQDVDRLQRRADELEKCALAPLLLQSNNSNNNNTIISSTNVVSLVSEKRSDTEAAAMSALSSENEALRQQIQVLETELAECREVEAVLAATVEAEQRRAQALDDEVARLRAELEISVARSRSASVRTSSVMSQQHHQPRSLSTYSEADVLDLLDSLGIDARHHAKFVGVNGEKLLDLYDTQRLGDRILRDRPALERIQGHIEAIDAESARIQKERKQRADVELVAHNLQAHTGLVRALRDVTALAESLQNQLVLSTSASLTAGALHNFLEKLLRVSVDGLVRGMTPGERRYVNLSTKLMHYASAEANAAAARAATSTGSYTLLRKRVSPNDLLAVSRVGAELRSMNV